MLEKFFKLSERHGVKTEILGRNHDIYDNGLYPCC